MRFRDVKPGDLDKTRTAVEQWRAAHPQGTPEQLVAEVGPHFHKDWVPVLRAELYVVDKHRSREVTGVITEAEPSR